jgi:hypothetical protein
MLLPSGPEKLKDVVSVKLDAAMLSLHELQQAEQPECNRYTEPQKYVDDFLYAARGVFSVIETFGEEKLQAAPFRRWVEAWEHTLKPEQLELWKAIGTEPAPQGYGDEERLVSTWLPITRGQVPEDFTNYAELGIPRAPGPTKSAVRFRAYPDKPASEVCAEYLKLVQRFVADFLRQHVRLAGLGDA